MPFIYIFLVETAMEFLLGCLVSISLHHFPFISNRVKWLLYIFLYPISYCESFGVCYVSYLKNKSIVRNGANVKREKQSLCVVVKILICFHVIWALADARVLYTNNSRRAISFFVFLILSVSIYFIVVFSIFRHFDVQNIKIIQRMFKLKLVI